MFTGIELGIPWNNFVTPSLLGNYSFTKWQTSSQQCCNWPAANCQFPYFDLAASSCRQSSLEMHVRIDVSNNNYQRICITLFCICDPFRFVAVSNINRRRRMVFLPAASLVIFSWYNQRWEVQNDIQLLLVPSISIALPQRQVNVLVQTRGNHPRDQP